MATWLLQQMKPKELGGVSQVEDLQNQNQEMGRHKRKNCQKVSYESKLLILGFKESLSRFYGMSIE
jgi:hypothetical protein